MVDRQARDQMAVVLRSYMAEEITAFELDKKLGGVVTDDQTARDVRFSIWFYYDDVTDHRIIADRQLWQYFNRLLLLLESDGEIKVLSKARSWPIWQVWNALILLAELLVWFFWRFDWSTYFMCNIASAPLIILLYRKMQTHSHRHSKPMEKNFPFSSYQNLLYWRRKLIHFQRMRYPANFRTTNRNHSFVMKLWMKFYWIVLIPVFAPIILLISLRPRWEIEKTVADSIAE